MTKQKTHGHAIKWSNLKRTISNTTYQHTEINRIEIANLDDDLYALHGMQSHLGIRHVYSTLGHVLDVREL